VAAQLADGGFPLALGPGTVAESNAYSTLLAVWALAEGERFGANDAEVGARKRAAAWLRRSMGPMAPSSVRVVAGLEEQSLFVLWRERALTHDLDEGDAERARALTADLLQRCSLSGTPLACQRAQSANGRMLIPGRTDKKPEVYVMVWFPWALLAADALASEPLLDERTRRSLTDVVSWGVREIHASAPAMASEPAFQLAEHLLAISWLALARH